MKIKFRDFNTLPKRKQVALLLANTVFGIGLALVADVSSGIPVTTSLRNIILLLSVGLLMMAGFAVVLRLKKRKNL